MIWVIIDRLTKSAHFLAIKDKLEPECLAQVFIAQIVRLHDTQKSIISDHDGRFVSHFLKAMHCALGTED